ncbi:MULTISPECIES: peptidyl-prolyl cis-trans isomerase [unclassified Acidovorax]|uniref:peptidylprolyl isomerase n=1 Tax=unclassified Acidovorax TaxID=2684926 RepID=UPI001C45087B|nr:MULTISPECIES: peptidylprolyl isomerase [unclassified Acidovorax]MBV7428767.1 peptidyl-prolyl cis-trans isomerase [Acidovorax sp. sif0732]MBV7450593.1 peptidyl-prolyl cis-trans isomerase [Acidovorax sp. sif0715]
MSNRFESYRRILGVSLLSLTGLLGGVAACAANLAKFAGGEVITASDMAQYLDRRVDLRSSARNKWGIERIVREMALTRVLVLEGERLGEPRLSGQESGRFDDAYAFAIFKKLAPVCSPPADGAAVRKFYDENPKAFLVPPMARVNRVMLPIAEAVDSQNAMEWLMAQAQAIASGAQTFDGVVKRADTIYRLDPQGDVGWVILAEENTIVRALATSRAGDMVGPVREGDFVYLFSISEKREGRQLSWDEVAVSASARAVSYCRQTGNKKLEEDLLSKYGMVMDAAGISSVFDKSESKR